MWRKGKWGMSWQMTPEVLIKAMSDSAAARRAFQAMMQMTKLM